MEEEENLTDLVRRLRDEADDGQVTLDDAMKAIGSRAIGPLLFIPSLLAISPIGEIPGMSIVLASVIILVAAQSIVSSDHIWLPEVLRKKKLPPDTWSAALDKAERWTKPLDRYFGRRLSTLVRPPIPSLIAAVCIVLAAAIVPLALIPFAVAAPAGAVLLFSIGLVTRDGLVIVCGGAVAVAAIVWAASTL
ncbi:exopolysaccharide biosynthesis protein [Algihabitans albus]|uniref:exopolysaccharide biosynthesis protein n=1 Tax=Algihabitans albus TaxID=2164067 RepID=UPI000E5C8343|nr:exopolysaccharide biosynthesis protein [Algihabitans albus]